MPTQTLVTDDKIREMFGASESDQMPESEAKEVRVRIARASQRYNAKLERVDPHAASVLEARKAAGRPAR